MKQKASEIIKLLTPVIIVIAIIAVMTVSVAVFGDNSHTLSYNDIALYTSGKYLSDDFTDDLRCASAYKLSDKFLPAPEDMDSDLNYDFYIYDGKANMYGTAVTVVLDVEYSDKARYSADKQSVLGQYAYLTEYGGTALATEKVSFQLYSFTCNIVDGEGYTDYPAYFGIICYSDNNLILRYYFFYELEGYEYPPTSTDYYADCSVCNWRYVE